MIKKVFSAILIYFLIVGHTSAQKPALKATWVDSVYNQLSLKAKIGQLFMVAAYSNGTDQQANNIKLLIKKYKIGGLIFMQGSPYKQAQLTNRFQNCADVPLLIGMDAEWGLGMRLDSTLSYPRQMTLGAINNDSLLYSMGVDIAQQMKILGVHVNFAPVVDINNNRKNPVIGIRSFGENKKLVAQKATAYMKGLQDNGIIACAKHFPGHGNTDKDSHKTLPKITQSRAKLDSVELYPFQYLIDKGVKSIMSAHLLVNAIDSKNPSSLSSTTIRGLLRDKMNFDGLVFSDALNMKAVSKNYKDLETQALAAGNDMLLFSQDVPTAIKSIEKALNKKQITEEQLEESVRKILGAKYDAGLKNYQPINTDNITLKLNQKSSKVLRDQLYEEAITLVRNNAEALPIKLLDNKYFASASIDSLPVFEHYLDKYTTFNHYKFDKPNLKKLSNYNYVVVGISKKPSAENLKLLAQLNKAVKIIIVYFGVPYALDAFEEFENIICTYEHNATTEKLAAEAIFGAVPTGGTLPVSVNEITHFGIGYRKNSISRLTYGIPESVGMDSKKLATIDQIIKEAIQDQATPGCQVLVARKGKVIFEQSYGYFTYDSARQVTDQTIYDIASVTKVLASMQAFMFLEEHGLVDLDKKIAVYIPELKGTNKEYMTFRDILTHQAGLWPYIPFWKQTLADTTYKAKFIAKEPQLGYTAPVSKGLFGSNLLRDSVWNWVKESKLREKDYHIPFDYKYSDMGYYLVQQLAEKEFNQPFEDFLQQNFYDPMGLSTLGYLPLCRFPLERIAPTEEDNYFRNTLVDGTVHDQGAALLGGVAGHAGLFSNANDMAKMMHMLLRDGIYGNQQYFKPETIKKFTSRQYANNRRGIGWDKPLRGVWYGPTSAYASSKTFGHTGFTGTAVWADPEFDLIFVFLSNRIHPDASNTKLIKNNIRTRIQDIIYESIWNYQQHAENINQ